VGGYILKVSLSPREIVTKLNENIVGQEEAKRKVAIAMRNRYRRMKLNDDLKNEVIPKNILMIGPTGVGKTEVARRMAKITGAPFTKVEATKYTEVGYVGRDVESMVRDLVEASVKLVKEHAVKAVEDEATKLANERIVKLLAPGIFKKKTTTNPFDMVQIYSQEQQHIEEIDDTVRTKRKDVANDLEKGLLEEKDIEIEVTEEQSLGMMMPGMDNGMGDMLKNMMPKKKKKRTLKVKKAREYLKREQAELLIDSDNVNEEAIKLAESLGIIFIDEIDKIAMNNNNQAGVSREGVQRDILPIVEGSVVETKYGPVNTEHILFIGAGAFHVSKPSDLIPELQGRFPIRVELDKLSANDFIRILKEPKNSLLKQYEALLQTEEVT